MRNLIAINRASIDFFANKYSQSEQQPALLPLGVTQVGTGSLMNKIFQGWLVRPEFYMSFHKESIERCQ